MNLKIIYSIRQNHYQNQSIPSLGKVRSTQVGLSAVARQARGLITTTRVV